MANKDIFDDKKQPDSDKSLPIIGIDLGTAYSCMGVWKDGKVNIIPNEIGQNKDPLYIAFTDTDILFGDTAKNQIYKNPKNTIFDITKLIGKNFYDYDIKENIKYWPLEIIKDPNSDNLLIKVTYKKQEKKYTPIEILTMLLEKMKKKSIRFLRARNKGCNNNYSSNSFLPTLHICNRKSMQSLWFKSFKIFK